MPPQPLHQTGHADGAAAAGIARVLQELLRQLAGQILFQPTGAVNIQQGVAVFAAHGEHAQPLGHQPPVQIADVVHELRAGLVAAGEQAAGLDAGQGGRALTDDQFIGHLIFPFLWSVCADPVGLYSEISCS